MKKTSRKQTTKSAKRTSASRKTQKTSKTTHKTETHKSAAGLLLAAGIALVVIIAAGLFFLSTKPAQSDIVATVNGEQITTGMLDFQYNLLPAAYKDAFSRDQVLGQIIDETLVVQAAKRDGITVTPQDVNERIQSIMAANSLSISDLQSNLDQLNVTVDKFEALITRQIYIERYTNKTIVVGAPDEKTLQALYNLSLSKYAIGEQVTVRHVLVASQRADAAVIAKGIYDAVRAGGDFCAFAKNSSDDRGSRDTCGQYTFPRGFMVPEFEKAAFAMANGEYRLVQSQFGYHIIYKVNGTTASVKSYADVKPQLVAEVQGAERSKLYREELDRLRASATIVYANGTVIRPSQPSSLEAGPTGPAPAAPAQDAPVKNDTAQPLPLPTTPPEQNAAPTPTSPIPAQSTKDVLSCIAGKATLYGTSWETDTQNALAMFTKEGVTLTYVACDKSYDVCTQKGIKAYPTWIVNGHVFLGRMSVDMLKSAADC